MKTHQPRNRTLESAGTEGSCERKTSLDGGGVDIPVLHSGVVGFLDKPLKWLDCPYILRTKMAAMSRARIGVMPGIGGENGNIILSLSPTSTIILIFDASNALSLVSTVPSDRAEFA